MYGRDVSGFAAGDTAAAARMSFVVEFDTSHQKKEAMKLNEFNGILLLESRCRLIFFCNFCLDVEVAKASEKRGSIQKEDQSAPKGSKR